MLPSLLVHEHVIEGRLTNQAVQLGKLAFLCRHREIVRAPWRGMPDQSTPAGTRE
jgi:hypothetical protein